MSKNTTPVLGKKSKDNLQKSVKEQPKKMGSGGIVGCIIALLVGGSLLLMSVLIIMMFTFAFMYIIYLGRSSYSGIPVITYENYNMGDEIHVGDGDLVLQIDSFEIVEAPSYTTNDLEVAVFIRVENNSYEDKSFASYNMRLSDSSGKLYDNSSRSQSYSGFDIFSDTYEEGYIYFPVDSVDDSFYFLYKDELFNRNINLKINLGYPVDFGTQGSDDYDPFSRICGSSYQFYCSLEGISEGNGKMKYSVEDLGFSIVLDETSSMERYNDCVYLNYDLRMGKVFIMEDGITDPCFNVDFSGVKNITSQTEKWQINGQIYDVEIEKLDYNYGGNQNIYPRGAIYIQNYNSSAFFHITLRGDKSDPTNPNYLGVEYFADWSAWENNKERIKGYLESIVLEPEGNF